MDNKLKDLSEALEKGSFPMNQNDGGSGGNTGNVGISGIINPNYGPGGGGGGIYQGGAAQDGGGFQSPPPRAKFSFNRFIVEPYLSDRQIKTANTTGGTGFAMIQQKVSIKPLRLLVDVMLDSGMQTSISLDGISTSQPLAIKAGSIVFIREELLHTQAWAKAIYESEYVGKFMIVDKQHIEFIQPV